MPLSKSRFPLSHCFRRLFGRLANQLTVPSVDRLILPSAFGRSLCCNVFGRLFLLVFNVSFCQLIQDQRMIFFWGSLGRTDELSRGSEDLTVT